MKMKKFIIKSLAALMLVSTTACSDDWLSLSDPNRESADTFWKTEQQYEEGLNAAYSVWRRPGMFSRWFHVLMLLRSDEGWSESPDPAFQAYGNFIITPYNKDGTEGINFPWEQTYYQLFFVNQVIDNVKERGYSVMAKDKVDLILGQAYFIRGLAFWYIAGTYGKGPLQLSQESNGAIAEQEELYRQALADFTAAKDVLPVKWSDSADLGKPTKGGALGMMARCNMQLAGICKRPWENRENEAAAFWQAAKQNMDDIFALNIYSLVPNWLDNFTEANENNSESLFEINFKNGVTNGKETGCQRAKFFGLYLSDGSGAWNDGSARDWLLDEFDKENQKNGKPDLRKYYTLFYANPDDNMKYYGKTYAQWNATEHFAHKAYWRKYTSVDTDNQPEDYSSGTNFRLLRLADVYLMYAEVINELGGDRSVAVEYINKVRRSVNMADLDASRFTDKETLKEQIRHEREVELCGECTRWNDLDRWGDIHTQEGVNKIAERDPDFLNYKVGINHLYIIPNHEISLYPGLTQNPGY